MIEITCKCNECYYHKAFDNYRVCSLQNKFLDNNIVGCYGGYKQRKEEAEKKMEKRK